MNKPYVFISHIGAESTLAALIKEQISQDFLGMIDVFVSSDSTSISVGSKWLNDIDAALKNAKVELIICSHDSISKPWINFEAGAGWVKGIPVVPICHTSLRPVDLPIPLNMLQGISASDTEGLKRLYAVLSKELGCAVPKQDFSDFVKGVLAFERHYGTIRLVREHVSALIKHLPDLRQIFEPNASHILASGSVQDILLDKMRPHLDELQSSGYIAYSAGSSSLRIGGSGGGVHFELRIEIQPPYKDVSTEVFKEID